MRGDEMAQLPRLRLIAAFGVGVDAIDLAQARSRGIAVTNTPDVLTEDVADLALALVLGTIRRIPQGDRFVREGHWLKGGMALTRSLQAARVGIVGLGRIGQAIAKRALAFDMSIAYTSRNPAPAVNYAYYPSAKELAANSDYLMVITPGGAATKHLVNAEVLAALGPKGYLINVARGGHLVDQDLLLRVAHLFDGSAHVIDHAGDEPGEGQDRDPHETDDERLARIRDGGHGDHHGGRRSRQTRALQPVDQPSVKLQDVHRYELTRAEEQGCGNFAER